MASRYVYRMDDIAPGMVWSRFWEYVELFRGHGVRPLLGVVPDNRDPKLSVEAPNPEFWEILRSLVRDRVVEIAQHGYRHLYDSPRYGILGRRYGFRAKSEFAGLPFDVQLDRVRRGQEILRKEGLPTDVWMAPSHTFDRETLRALRRAGFGAVTDGIALHPFRRDGLVFVPQQLWRPKKLSLGTWTICLHANTAEEDLLVRVREHLESGAKFIPFSVARERAAGPLRSLANAAFSVTYMTNIYRHRVRGRLPGPEE